MVPLDSDLPTFVLVDDTVFIDTLRVVNRDVAELQKQLDAQKKLVSKLNALVANPPVVRPSPSKPEDTNRENPSTASVPASNLLVG